jgi:hypothetical protein
MWNLSINHQINSIQTVIATCIKFEPTAIESMGLTQPMPQFHSFWSRMAYAHVLQSRLVAGKLCRFCSSFKAVKRSKVCLFLFILNHTIGQYWWSLRKAVRLRKSLLDTIGF